MNKLKLSRSGFSVVEGFIVLLVLVVIGFASYYVLRAHEQKPSTQSAVSTEKSVSPKPAPVTPAKPITLTLLAGVKSTASPLTYSRDTASVIDNIVSFAQPSDWRDDTDTTATGCGVASCLNQTLIGPANEDEDGAGPPDYFVVTVSAFQTNNDAKTIFANNWQDSTDAASSAYSSFLTTSGIKGFKYDYELTTPTASNGNSYTEHVAYGLSNGNTAAILNVLYFNHRNNSFPSKHNTDYGQYAATVEEIAKSLHLGN